MAPGDNVKCTPGFAEEAAVFKGSTRNARVLSEGWVAANAFCPGCGATPLTAFAAKAPVADFHCGVCAEGYELKATRGRGAIFPFVIPGGGALAPETRKGAARGSAKLSRTPAAAWSVGGAERSPALRCGAASFRVFAALRPE